MRIATSAPNPLQRLQRRCRRGKVGALWPGVVSLAAGLSFGLGCSRDATSPLAAADVVGAYALVTVGGKPLPGPNGEGTVITSDVYALAADGTWTDESHAQHTDGTGRIVERYTGTWTVDGPRALLTLTQPLKYPLPSAVQTMQVEDGGRTLRSPGPSERGGDWVYRKQ